MIASDSVYMHEMQGESRGPAHQALERRPANLVTTAHVAGRRDHVRAVKRERDHRIHDVRLV